MSVFIIGGTGFIGHRLVRLLVTRGQTVTCMDINPGAHSFADLGKKVTSVRGDVTQFDDVMAAMSAAKPERVVNLSYFIGRLPEMKITDPYSPMARANARVKPLSSAGNTLGSSTRVKTSAISSTWIGQRIASL